MICEGPTVICVGNERFSRVMNCIIEISKNVRITHFSFPHFYSRSPETNVNWFSYENKQRRICLLWPVGVRQSRRETHTRQYVLHTQVHRHRHTYVLYTRLSIHRDVVDVVAMSRCELAACSSLFMVRQSERGAAVSTKPRPPEPRLQKRGNEKKDGRKFYVIRE